MPKGNIHGKVNRLINEKSPYLLQHAENPVDWYPWGEEAFKRAKDEDKPIFLSTGYSSCRWCHVMMRESFMDNDVSNLLNNNFISIKVDREERPDVDSFYMNVCQMMTGGGGWPLSIFMTPDKKPFFAGTYFPRESNYGRMGFIDLLKRINDIWKNEREKLIETADRVIGAFDRDSDNFKINDVDYEKIMLNSYNEFLQRFDREYGGFGTSPKFPSAHNLLFLVDYYRKYGEKRTLDMVLKTLELMAGGGIYDHVGGGFHRYSTDQVWKVPHFEKMLYDQGFNLMAYIEVYLETGDNFFKEIGEGIGNYLINKMQDNEGGFYSAEDAESLGLEGKFYLWSYDEIESILSKDEFKLLKKYYHIKKEGNFIGEVEEKTTGENIFYTKNIRERVFDKGIGDTMNKLNIVREKRIKPKVDKKILTDWNGIVISALSNASIAFKRDDFYSSAKKSADFILKNYKEKELLNHSFYDGIWSDSRFIDDYSYFINGLLDLYQVEFEGKYLFYALKISKEMIDMYFDRERGGFFQSVMGGEDIPKNIKETYDGAYPSGNSSAFRAIVRLFKLTGDEIYSEAINKTMEFYSSDIFDMPSTKSYYLSGVNHLNSQSYEVVVAGEGETAINMGKKLRDVYIPNKTTVLKLKEEELSFLSDYKIIKNPSIYICKGFSCSSPVFTYDEACKILLKE